MRGLDTKRVRFRLAFCRAFAAALFACAPIEAARAIDIFDVIRAIPTIHIEPPRQPEPQRGARQVAEIARPSSEVGVAQELLNGLGYDVGHADGVLGPKTRKAIRSFQADHDLPVDGRITPDMMAALKDSRSRGEAAADRPIRRAAEAPSATGEPPAVRVPDAARGGRDIDAMGTESQENPVGADDTDRLAEVACASRPRPQDYARPTEVEPDKEGDLQTYHVYSHGPDTILVERKEKVVSHTAGGGDDIMYIDGPQSGTGIAGEDGGDTFVVCGLSDPDMVLDPGPKDIAADIIVVDEPVFASLPAGRPLLMIARFHSETDRLIVRAPPRTSVSFDPLYINVGDLRIQVLGTGDERVGPFDLQSITIFSGERRLHPPRTMSFAGEPPRVGKAQSTKLAQTGALSLAGKAVNDIPAADACADRGLVANPAVPIDHPVWKAFGDRQVRYTDSDDAVVFTGTGRHSFVDAAGGNDTIFAFEAASGTTLQGGSAADLITVCSLERSAVSFYVNMGNGDTAKDLDSDILVLRPQVFTDVPAGFVREVYVFDFLPANDRLFLWLPAGTDVTFTDLGTGAADVRVGNVLVKLYRSDNFLEGPFDWDSVVLAPTGTIPPKTAAAASPQQRQSLGWTWGKPRTMSGDQASFSEPNPNCDGVRFLQQERLASPLAAERYGEEVLVYTHGPDLVRLDATDRPTNAIPGRGDDSVYLMDVSDDLGVQAGSGSDTIILCSMKGATLNLSPGPGLVDRHPDTIVIEPEVFFGIPKGVTRDIRISGFMPVNDRLIVRVPANLEPKGRPGNGLAYDLVIGQVRIELAAGGFSLDLEFDPDAIVLVPGSRSEAQ